MSLVDDTVEEAPTQMEGAALRRRDSGGAAPAPSGPIAGVAELRPPTCSADMFSCADATTAVILPPTDASFLDVAGLPLIVRTALSLQRGGFEQIAAMGGDEAPRLRQLFDRDPRTRTIALLNKELAPLDGSDAVVLVPSDRLVTAAMAAHLRSTDPPSSFINNGTLPLSDAASIRAAEDRLVSEIRAASADTDGPIARFDRALSTRLSRYLVRTPLRPNHLTVIGTAIGLVAAWSFARGTYAGGVLGALLFWAAVIVDGCDGEVARLKFQESRFGQLFDVITDNVVHVAVFAALGIGLYRADPGGPHLRLVALLIGGFLCATAATYFCLLRHPPVKYLTPSSFRGKVRQKLLRGFEALMNRDFAYLLLPLAVLGCLHWFLWGAAIGTYVFAALLVGTYRWRDAA